MLSYFYPPERLQNFFRQNLQKFDLRWANLQNAQLKSTDLRGTNLEGADLSNATLESARVDLNTLDGAYLCNTTLPNGNTSNQNCGTEKPKMSRFIWIADAWNGFITAVLGKLRYSFGARRTYWQRSPCTSSLRERL
jgi:hypothetical protein